MGYPHLRKPRHLDEYPFKVSNHETSRPSPGPTAMALDGGTQVNALLEAVFNLRLEDCLRESDPDRNGHILGSVTEVTTGHPKFYQ